LFYRGDSGDFLPWKDSLSAKALQWGGGEDRERKNISTYWQGEFVLFALQGTHAIIRFATR
jgi:hypothetical protein